MAADGEGGGEEASSFRWIDVARYAVASVVTILMVVVVVKAKMLLRPKPLYLSVPGGSLFVMPVDVDDEALLNFTIRAQNPSGRASLYYLNVSGYIFDNMNMSAESSSNPRNDSIVFFQLEDMFLPQNAEQFRSMTVLLLRGMNMKNGTAASYFEGQGRNIIFDVTLRLDATLVVQPLSSYNTTPAPTTFYCRPLLIISGNRDVDAYINKQEAFCVS